ncbi:MAG: B12-binding domain-containing radical SAM protein [Candidatus Nanoarchaeia archaeon]|nr:B12-binding domain-containing radical SAM protein [Candidatus Nanoarchaeia archaeon]MDD5239801.1 B12-binding domain-containing radical SAM protein [Candidatus Nanoarchaeia archaeon]
MKILFAYAPFCAATVMPYSITYLSAFLRANSDIKTECVDLNAKFHRTRFPEFYKRINKKMPVEEFGKVLEEFNTASREVYAENHKAIVAGAKPEFFKEMLKLMIDKKPDVVGFSLVYNSQVPYAIELMKELNKKGIKCIAGGPAANMKITEHAVVLEDEFELPKYFGIAKENYKDVVVDFSEYNKSDYLAKELIYPMRSCRGCFYGQCAFCTHSLNQKYRELPVAEIKKAIELNKMKYVFFIDDSITPKRLLEISDALKDSKVKWWAQLRPTKELLGNFKKLSAGGLKSVAWGVESGNQAVLDKMRKGTNVQDVKAVLKESHDAGIVNTVFIMFGFPGETKKEFMDTIDFLKENSANIDLVSTSVFGLQKGSTVYNNPKEFGITEIRETAREYLDARVDYKTATSDKESAKRLRSRHMKSILAINKLPRAFVTFKEQTLLCD